MKNERAALVFAFLLGAVAGCENESDARLAEVTRQSLAAQARQNERMADQSQEIATASRRLVEGDAASRHEMVTAQKDLQQGLQVERGRVDKQRDDLEQERRRLASQRRTDPVIAESIKFVSVLLACLSPLLLAAYVLYVANRRSEEADTLDAVNQILIGEIVSAEPRLLPPPPARRLQDRSRANPEPDSPVRNDDGHIRG